MIFLDTHALVFLVSDPEQIPRAVWPILDEGDLVYSPMARLELDFLYEIGRVTEDSRTILDILSRDFGVKVETEGWLRASEVASHVSFTRDPFDRIIVAHAMVWGLPLLSRDKKIAEFYKHTFWSGAPV